MHDVSELTKIDRFEQKFYDLFIFQIFDNTYLYSDTSIRLLYIAVTKINVKKEKSPLKNHLPRIPKSGLFYVYHFIFIYWNNSKIFSPWNKYEELRWKNNFQSITIYFELLLQILNHNRKKEIKHIDFDVDHSRWNHILRENFFTLKLFIRIITKLIKKIHEKNVRRKNGNQPRRRRKRGGVDYHILVHHLHQSTGKLKLYILLNGLPWYTFTNF